MSFFNLARHSRESRTAQAALLSLFLLGLWISYSLVETLGPPDFYTYILQGRKMLALDFSDLMVPPLYPLLLALGEKTGNLLGAGTAFLLWLGRVISLAAGLACAFRLRSLARIGAEPAAGLLPWAVCLSPIFLAQFALPLTDVLFLAFFLGWLAATAEGRARNTVIWALLAAATRFEGLLLLPPTVFLLLKGIRRTWLRRVMMLGFSLACLPAYLLLTRAFSRKTLELVGEPGIILNFVLHPGRLVEILYGNFFSFAPGAPPVLQVVLLAGTAVVLAAGLIAVHRRNRFLAGACAYFLAAFFLFKGYLPDSLPGEIHSRRLLPGLVLIMVGVFWGLQYLLELLRRGGRSQRALVTALALLIGFGFSGAHRAARLEAESIPNRGAYALARYFNQRPEGDHRSILLTHADTYQYFRQGPTAADPLRRISLEDESQVRQNLKKQFERKDIRRIAFDFYLARPNSWHRSAKLFLMNHTEDQDLWLARPLYHRGRLAAMVLLPRQRESVRVRRDQAGRTIRPRRQWVDLQID